MMRHIIDDAIADFERIDDLRTLVIIEGCPCCDESYDVASAAHGRPETILVSPFKGIDVAGLTRIVTMDVYPPFRYPGVGDECRDAKHYRLKWHETIANAIRDSTVRN